MVFYCCYAQAQWVNQTVPDEVTMLLSLDFENTLGVASGYSASEVTLNGQAIATTNSGNTWVLVSVPDSTRSLTSVELFDNGTAYAFGAYNVTGATISRGFARIDRSLLGRGIERYLARTGIVNGASYNAMFLRSSNAGLHWTVRNSLPEGIFYLLSSSFVNDSLGYVTADASPSFGIARMLRTSDGGNTWSILTTPDSIVLLRNVVFTDADHGVAVGYRIREAAFAGVIIRTTNGGATWQSVEFPDVNNFTDVAFPTSLIGYVTGTNSLSGVGVVCMTTDGGSNWLQLSYSPPDAIIEGIEFTQGSMAGVLHGVKDVQPGARELRPFFARTTDGGQSWRDTAFTGLPDNTTFTDAFFVSAEEGYICGGNLQEAVMLYTDNGGVAAIDPSSDAMPGLFHLQQNFPNPFNPSTIIVYQQTTSNWVTLKVYDALGREIVTLIDQEMDAGEHRVRMDGTGLTSGSYFCRLQTAGYTQTRMMILLK